MLLMLQRRLKKNNYYLFLFTIFNNKIMKKIFYVFALLCAVVLTGCNNDSLTPEGDKTQLWPAMEDNGELTGFINAQGKFAIKPQYSEVYSFSCGWCFVREEGLNGERKFIDKNNKSARGFDEENLSDRFFYYDRLTFRDGDYYGKYDRNFNKVIKADYKSLGATADNGYCSYSEDGKNYGYLDKNGKEVIDDDFVYAGDFADGIAIVNEKINDTYKMGVIDAKGNYLIEPQNKELMNMGEGRVGFRNSKGKYGMMDKNGNDIVEAKYDGGSPFSCGLSLVYKDGKYGFINTRGDEVIDTRYIMATDFMEDMAWVQKNEDSKIELINKRGDVILSLKASEFPASTFHNGLALVVSESESGYIHRYINKKGDQIYKWEYVWNNDYAPKRENLREMSKREMLGTAKGYLFKQNLEEVR